MFVAKSSGSNPKEERERSLKSRLSPDPNIGETVFFTGLCVLHKHLDGSSAQEKIGSGMAQILQNTSNNRCRLLIRNSNDLDSPLLNCYILYDIKQLTSSQYQFEAISYTNPVSKTNYSISLTNNNNGEQFVENYVKAFSINLQLIK